MSDASKSDATKAVDVQYARLVVVEAAKLVVDAKSGEQRGYAIGALFDAVGNLRKAGG